MNIIGKWKIDKIMGRDNNMNVVYLDRNEFKAQQLELGRSDEFIEDALVMFDSLYEFCDDNSIRSHMPVPEGLTEEEIAEAVAEEGITIEDGMAVSRDQNWKEENGKFFSEEGVNEQTGEMTYDEIKIVDEDTIDFMIYRLVRA